ncbi:MAG TPA: PSD1 and planctomycete cytochrome C domain-containing protein [Humisphaera sp.]
MRFRPSVVLPAAAAALAACFAAPSPARAADAEGNAFFEAKIRPVLIESCYSCHSVGKDAKVKGELRLDTPAGTRKGGASGEAGVVPGEPDKSAVIKAIRYVDQDLLMPPKKRLPAEVVRDFERWVKMGAPDPRTEAPTAGAQAAAQPHAYKPPKADSDEARAHWAFKPVEPPKVPAVKDAGWARTDVDRFVLAKLEAKGLKPAGRADARTLIRRATFDLTGLPPTPEEVEAFERDPSPEAFAKVVDRLLASPAYGERWGRHWLDVARYADTAGESADYPVPQAVKYRDYVIAAFNADKPYDRFLKEQIAGDLLPAAGEQQRREQIVATGFLATARRFSVAPETAMHLTIEDVLDTTGKAVLGLSLSCARCHDHKFDPIPTSDYYALYGIFGSTRFPFPGSENTKFQRDFVPLVDKAEADRILGPLAAQIADAERAYREAKKARRESRDQKEQDRLRKAETDAQKRAAALAAQAPPIDDAYAVADAEQTADAPVQKRGEPYDKGDVVRRGFLTVLGGQKLPDGYQGSGRLELANWLTDAKNPLTARVMANRIWQHHFGRGIVKTPNDFGSRGLPPTNPELLDHLAAKFVEGGWSMKAMHRMVMLSATYQMSGATADPRNEAVDPTNEHLWRFDRQRLDAESIRDALLAVSGKLDPTPGGPHPFPPKTKWTFTQHAPFTAAYETDKRSVYLMVQRIRRHPYLATFDGADPNASTGDRLVSTTPLQALFMMNDKFVHAAADGLAARAATAGDEPQQVERAFKLALGRGPTPDEAAAGTSYLRQYAEQAAAEKLADGEAARRAALASLCRAILGSNEFVFVE